MKPMSFAVVAALLVPVLAHGQAPRAPLLLALDDAITRGLIASHRIAEATARRDASDAVADQRHAATRPQVMTQAGYMRTNHVDEFGILSPNNQLRVIYPDVPDNYRARLDVAWPVYTGGRFDSLEEAARRESAATTGDIDALRADLRLDIARAFWGLVVADESLRVVNESLTRMGVHLRDIRNLVEAGLVPPNEVLSAQAQESRQRMMGIQARSSRDVAEADLARLVGAPPGTLIQTVTAPPPEGEGASLESLVARALDQRADRRALLARQAAAALREEAAAAGRRPTIAIGGGVDYGRPNTRIFPRQAAWNESWDASININWPLFDGGRTRADMAEAAAGRRGLQARLAELDQTTAFEVRQRVAEVESSRAVISAAEDGFRAATEAHRVVGERFNAGVATSTDVLDAQGVVMQAGLDRVQAFASARLADARLKRALGQ